MCSLVEETRKPKLVSHEWYLELDVHTMADNGDGHCVSPVADHDHDTSRCFHASGREAS
jgi:hypothetical protein